MARKNRRIPVKGRKRLEMSNSIGCPYYRLTTVSVTDPVNDSVNDSVTDVVNYPLFLMYIERL